ncbi:MAG: hypothetical protein Ct9H300mP31_12950 [Acidimicrobiaceae bacterium]|nr:MAG: hypothetical protein Ct9H300mP31_12950 [Acidimicrobiaceae bacterium]
MVDPRVLIPRPETEVVAGLALAEVDRVAAGPDRQSGEGGGLGDRIGGHRPVDRRPSALEPGCGVPTCPTGALAVARANCAGLGRPARRVTLAEGSWFEALPTELNPASTWWWPTPLT